MTPPARLLRRPRSFAPLACAAALCCASGPWAPDAAAVPTVVPQTVASYVATEYSDRLLFERLGTDLLRADGSLGTFVQERSGRYGLASVVSIGGPSSPDALRSQPLTSATRLVLDYPPVVASGIEGYDWLFDQPGRVPPSDPNSGAPAALVAVDDHARVARRVTLLPTTVPADTEPVRPADLIPTGKGLRILGERRRIEIWTSSGRQVARVSKLAGVTGAVGRPDGSVLLSGRQASLQPSWKHTWDNLIVRVGARGSVQRVSLRGQPGRYVQGQPLAAVRGGTLIGDKDGNFRIETLQRLSDSRRLITRDLTKLDLPWSSDCIARKQAFNVEWAIAGTTGEPVLGLSCVRTADRTDEIIEMFTVGLDDRLRLRWFGPGVERPSIGPDGRLYSAKLVAGSYVDYELQAIAEPGAPGPRRGEVVQVRRAGTGAVVTISCRAVEGSVCSGTVRLMGAGGTSSTLPYALRGRPGVAGASIRRQFDEAPAGRLRATLSRR